MPTSRMILLLSLLTLIAGVGAAFADEPPTAQGDPKTVAPAVAAPVIPDLPENAAEIEALKNGAGPGSLAEPQSEATAGQPADEPTPRTHALRAVLDAEQAQLAELQGRLESAPDTDAALAIQREIEQVKQQTEIDLLAAQARFAREAGQEEQAVAIEAAITELTAPRPVGVPQDRPAPADPRR